MNRFSNPKLTPLSQSLRKRMTKEEKHLWYDCLKKMPKTVNRQKVIGKYIEERAVDEVEEPKSTLHVELNCPLRDR